MALLVLRSVGSCVGQNQMCHLCVGYFFYVFMQQKFHCHIVGSSVFLHWPITLKYTQLLSYFLYCGYQQYKKYDNTLFVFQVQIVERTFDIFQRSVADVCVAQRGFDVVVPQEFLDEFEVCPRLVEVSGVAMPQTVKSNVL